MTTTPAPKYLSDGAQRLLSIVRALAGNEVEGIAPGELAKAVGCAPSQVTHALANLKHFGWAEQVPGAANRWRLGPQIVQIAMRHMTAMERAERRLAETKNRFSRGPLDLTELATPLAPL